MVMGFASYAEDVERSGWQNRAVDGAGGYGQIWKVLYFTEIPKGDSTMPTYEHNRDRVAQRVKHTLYALYKCLYHWEFMCATGTMRKREFWGCRYFKQVKYYYIPVAECYTCANMISNAASSALAYTTGGCRRCALTGFAWYKECTSWRSSLYADWQRANTDADRAIYAQKMVDAIKEAIKYHEMRRLRKYNG